MSGLSNLSGVRISGNRYGGANQRTVAGGVEAIGKEVISPGLSPFDEHTKRQAPLRVTSSGDRQNADLYEQNNVVRDQKAAELLARCNMLPVSKPKRPRIPRPTVLVESWGTLTKRRFLEASFSLLLCALQYTRTNLSSMWNLIFLGSYVIIAFLLTFFLIPPFIRLLWKFKLGKTIRQEALMGKATEFAKLHKEKEWTPTMGMAIVFFAIFLLVGISVILQFFAPEIKEYFGITIKYSLWNRNETYLSLFTLFAVGAIGLVDDYMNILGIGRTKGLSARVKMILLLIFAGLGAYWFYVKLGYTHVKVPLLGNLDLGFFYIPIFMLIIVSMANAVNITDGLDGLAGGILLFNYGVYAFICYNRGLMILAALCMIIVGGLIAFLWFNIKPAKFYMWDVWALALWANLAIIAMMTNTLIVLVIISGIYIVEILSVILQLASKKLRGGKKIFRIAPFHHHLEAVGWWEETVVMRFWLVGMILSAIGLIVSLLIQH